MKTHKLLWVSVFFLILAFSSQTASAGLFDDDKNNWRRIFAEIKKINARLVELKTGKLKAIESFQQDLSRQIEDIKSLLPNLQGSVEQSQAEISGYFKTTNQKLADIEMQIKMEIIKNVKQQLAKLDQQIASQLNRQKIANDQFQDNLAEKFRDLKSGMAADMENFAKLNQKNSQELARLNRDTLAMVNTQKQSLDKTNEIIKSELIPQISTEMSKTSNAFLASVSQARKENKEALRAGLSGIEAKNQKLLEVLERNLKEGEATRGNIELLSKSMGTTNKNVVLIHDDIVKLKDGMVQQMGTLSKGQQNLAVQVSAGSQKMDKQIEIIFRNMRVADEKINKLAESLNGLQSNSLASRADLASLQLNMAKVLGNNALNGEKLNKIITSSSELATHSRELTIQNNEMGQSITQLVTHSGQVNQSLKNVGQALQTIQGGLANVDNVNEKLTTLIGILKTIAAEQGKFAEVITGQSEIKQFQMELNQVQVKMSQAQAEMSQAQIQMGKNQGVINQTQLDEKQILEQTNQHQARILKAQEEIKSSQIQIIKAQGEIRSAQRQTLKTQFDVKKNLADLSRKANVNISRNDAIRKTLANLGKKSFRPPPPKQ